MSPTPISNDLVYPFRVLLVYYILALGVGTGLSTVIFFVLGFGIGFYPSPNSSGGEKGLSSFILLHHLFDTICGFGIGLILFYPSLSSICDYYIALLHHLFNAWFGS